MKTSLPKQASLTQKWYLVNARDKTLGRMATTVANKLRGKDKPYFTPQMDCGDFVIVINAEKVKLTGKKLTDKIYYRHTGFPGGIKSPSAEYVLKKAPTKIIELAVRGMLPKNRLRKEFMKKLKLYVGENHPHEAQKPEPLIV